MQIGFAGDLFGRGATSALQRQLAWLEQRGARASFPGSFDGCTDCRITLLVESGLAPDPDDKTRSVMRKLKIGKKIPGTNFVRVVWAFQYAFAFSWKIPVTNTVQHGNT
jgi:hypothetical protein